MNKGKMHLNESTIKAVENLNGLIWTAMADILLTAVGLRPSTFIYLESPVYSTNDVVM